MSEKRKASTGVVHGRFQLLHKDHVKYIMAAKERCEQLVIGICNPDPELTKYSEENPHRSTAKANPFSYYERYQMIKGTLLELGVNPEEFDIVPFPINYPELIFNYAPRHAKYYMTTYDEWGYEKRKKLEEIGCDIEVLWDVPLEQKGISGSDVRERIVKGQEWKSYVPEFVFDYIVRNHLDEKLKSFCNYAVNSNYNSLLFRP